MIIKNYKATVTIEQVIKCLLSCKQRSDKQRDHWASQIKVLTCSFHPGIQVRWLTKIDIEAKRYRNNIVYMSIQLVICIHLSSQYSKPALIATKTCICIFVGFNQSKCFYHTWGCYTEKTRFVRSYPDNAVLQKAYL